MIVQPAPADEDKTWLDEDDETTILPPLESDPEDPSADWDSRVASVIKAKDVLGDEATPEGIITIARFLLGESQPET